jgi:hypothetical protein
MEEVMHEVDRKEPKQVAVAIGHGELGSPSRWRMNQPGNKP